MIWGTWEGQLFWFLSRFFVLPISGPDQNATCFEEATGTNSKSTGASHFLLAWRQNFSLTDIQLEFACKSHFRAPLAFAVYSTSQNKRKFAEVWSTGRIHWNHLEQRCWTFVKSSSALLPLPSLLRSRWFTSSAFMTFPNIRPKLWNLHTNKSSRHKAEIDAENNTPQNHFVVLNLVIIMPSLVQVV